MGFFDDFFGDQEQKTTTESKTTLPGYVNDASKWRAGEAMAEAKKPYTPYGGDRVAGFNPDQKAAFGATRDFATGGGQELLDQVRNYSTSPGQDVPFYSLIDPTSPLGGIEGYMNPYQDTVLDNALAKIYDAADRAKLNLNSRATSAGAFGDARHGVEGGLLNLDTMRAVGETSGDLMKEMFDTMMGWRTSDLGRLHSTDVSNANFAETALNRQAQGAGQEQNMKLQQLAALLGTGQMQQGNAQAKLDAKYEEYLREQGWDENQIKFAQSILAGIPTERTTTGETTQVTPNNSGFQLLGTLAGAVAAPFTGGASLALPSLMSGMGGGGGVGPHADRSQSPLALAG